MAYTDETSEEIKILLRFNLNTDLEGIKVHSNASSEAISASKRLFAKGLITQADGGYLTVLGRTAAEHAQDLLQILKSPAG